MNNDLRARIVEMVYRGGDGHIPSAFSIIDLVATLFDEELQFDAARPDWDERDYFVLSKGHGCPALYVTLHRHGFLTEDDLAAFCTADGILGEHPDVTRVPGVEASTGSLGHGLPFALGLALGLRIQGRDNRLFVLCGDGECNEGTIWESALVAANLRLGNLCLIVDLNGSAQQILPVQPLAEKFQAFGWRTDEVDGHDLESIRGGLSRLSFASEAAPQVIVAHTLKGKGVPLLEGHGIWHHRIPNAEEYAEIMEALQ